MQISPIYLLIILLVGLFLLALLYPRRGILARYRAWRGTATRRQIEDALKYFFNQEQEGDHVTVDSLAGALDIHTRAAVNLLIKMQDQGLLVQDERYVTLTPEGRRLAVQVTRAHRLLERYLADEARMPLEQVHNEANQREHGLSSAEVDALDADLGYPTHDPHGDPIPDPGGRPRAKESPAVSLPGLQVGQRGRISHLEDEPQIAYAQLVAQGFFLGQPITVLEKTPAKIVLTDGDQEFSIAPGKEIALTDFALEVKEVRAAFWDHPLLRNPLRQCTVALDIKTPSGKVEKEIKFLHPIRFGGWTFHLETNPKAPPTNPPDLSLVLKKDPGVTFVLIGGALMSLLMGWYFLELTQAKKEK